MAAKTIRTQYRFIEFTESILARTWLCMNRKHQDLLGFVTYCEDWRQWVFEPEDECQFSTACLYDVIHFIRQLPTNPNQRSA